MFDFNCINNLAVSLVGNGVLFGGVDCVDFGIGGDVLAVLIPCSGMTGLSGNLGSGCILTVFDFNCINNLAVSLVGNNQFFACGNGNFDFGGRIAIRVTLHTDEVLACCKAGKGGCVNGRVTAFAVLAVFHIGGDTGNDAIHLAGCRFIGFAKAGGGSLVCLCNTKGYNSGLAILFDACASSTYINIIFVSNGQIAALPAVRIGNGCLFLYAVVGKVTGRCGEGCGCLVTAGALFGNHILACCVGVAVGVVVHILTGKDIGLVCGPGNLAKIGAADKLADVKLHIILFSQQFGNSAVYRSSESRGRCALLIVFIQRHEINRIAGTDLQRVYRCGRCGKGIGVVFTRSQGVGDIGVIVPKLYGAFCCIVKG